MYLIDYLNCNTRSGAVLMHSPTALYCPSLHITVLNCTASLLHYIALHCAVILRSSRIDFFNLHWTAGLFHALRQTALHCPALHCTSLHLTALPSTALYCMSLRCTALCCTSLHITALKCTSSLLHYIALHRTALHCTALHCNALHFTALHFTALNSTALQCSAVQWRQFDDFGCFLKKKLKSGGVFSTKSKIPKNDYLEKVKI